MLRLTLFLVSQILLVNSSVLQRAGEGWAAAANQYKYIVGTKGMPWSFAKTYCESKGARLATDGIRNELVRQYLYDYFLPHSRNVWIGLTDQAVEGKWEWIDNVQSKAQNTQWSVGQPSIHDCGKMRKPGGPTIAAHDCKSRYLPLCELAPTSFL